jgi:threonine dehydrogenase-like Zn-dependent dehydrogenase
VKPDGHVEALLFRHEVGRYLVSRFLFQYAPALWSTRVAPLDRVVLPRPSSGAPGWVRLRVRLSGICGTDLSMVTGRDSLYLEPEATYPFVPGHEIVGEVTEDSDVPPNARDVRPGSRVAVWPVIGCVARGYSLPCEPCAGGWDGLCERRAAAPWPGSALALGFSRETGGGWSDACLAHVSQLWPLPGSVEDGDALLLDPSATALGALLRGDGPAPERTLVIGGGTIGLLCAYLARRLSLPGRTELLVRHESQRRWAEAHGLQAEVVRGERAFGVWASGRTMRVTRVTGYGNVVHGTFDRVIDAAGTRSSLRWAMSAVRAGGELVLTTAPHALGSVDPTPLWYRELRCRGVNGYGPVRWQGASAHPYSVLLPRLADGSLRLRDLHTHTFPLRDYGAAIATALRKESGAIKVAFAPTPAARANPGPA